MKRLISLLLTTAMLFGLICFPVSAAEPVIYTTKDANYTEDGSWATTTKAELQGYPGVPSRYLSTEGSATWVPELKQGTYKVSVYKTVHSASLNNQIFEIVHRGKTDYAVVDFVTGDAGWTELGTFDFWGDGDDRITVIREAGLDIAKATRLSAISFELVEQINDPIPNPKPEVIPGEKPDVDPIIEMAPVSIAVKPVNVGDVMIIPANDPYYYTASGSWGVSGAVVGYDGNGSAYCSNVGGKFTYTPYMPAGTYKVEFFKSVHENSLKEQEVVINHTDKTDSKIIDCTQGQAGWVDLGTYDFWGNGNDSITATNNGDGLRALRTSAVRFTLVKLSTTPAPTGKADPANANAEINMDIPALPIAYDGISVVIDNVLQKYDQPAVMVDDRTLVPLRGIFEALGAKVYWTDETQTVTAIKDDTTVILQIGNTAASKNGETITLDVPAQLINDRTLVPVRFVSEALGAQVDWNEENQAVLIQTGEKGPDSMFISARSFQDLGTWRADSQAGAFGDYNLKGKEDESFESEPAKIKVKIYETGEYNVFIHSRDYATNQQGTRYFEVELNGQRVPKVFGQHGKTGFYWEKIGPVNLEQGELEIALHDTSTFYARCDGIYITKKTTKKPPEDYDSILKVATVVGNEYNSDVFYPVWAADADAASAAVNTIASDTVKLDFYTVETPTGTAIQKEMTVNGEMTTSRENTMGALLMYAKEGSSTAQSGQFPLYDVTYTKGGVLTSAREGDIYQIGEPSWLIPSKIEIIDEKTALLSATNNYADATFKVELRDGETEPVVTFTLYPKIEGQFTANIMSGAESAEYSYAFCPFRSNGMVLPVESLVVTEPYATIPMVLKTVKNTNDKNVTVGIAVEPESVPKAWPKAATAEYGFSLRGPEGGALPSLLAPLYTSENSKMQAGDSYSITYRMIESIGEWYPIYEHFALDIYGLTDYRSNYFSTLTDAIFNTTALAADDYAGWDANQKGYSNIEAENLVTQSNPLVFMSTYLLTEDKDFLERRTIPTLAFLLTRPGFHYNNGDIEGIPTYGGVSPIGELCKNYGNAVYGGGYVMSQELVPQLKEQGIDKGLLTVDSYGTSPKYMNYLWLYNYTGDESYLAKSKEEADKFIEQNIDVERNIRLLNEEMFIAIDSYPQFFGLIDLYEVTGEQKYIDAAVKAARNLLPTVWIYPNSETGTDYTTSADYIRENHYGKDHISWNIKERYRAGYPENLDKLEDQTLPFWVVSRAGLSLEQTFTYTMHDSRNMIMANWAPDLMRLAEYSGEEIFETYARNAIVGRHTTYSGYYYNNYFAYQQDKNYPYEGPDLTGLYWHHMQPFLAMLQDFLFTQAWNWSDRKIDFPSVRNTGYAYFTNRMYGGESGTFYDENDMWLWLKEGLVETDNVQLDWFGARKDGVAFFTFMNEDTNEQSATVTFGEELANYSGEAAVYDAQGNITSATVTDGKLTITVPGRTLVSVKLKSDAVTAPTYANVTIDASSAGKQTAKPKDGETDTGHILQMSGDEYFAYVYITEGLNEAEKLTLHYKIGNGEWQTADDTYSPFEFIIRVDDTNANFTYYVEKIIEGKTVKSSQKTLSPLGKNAD